MKRLLDVFIVCAVIAGVALVVWAGLRLAQVSQREVLSPLPTEPLALAALTTRGSRTARVAVVEFSDFDCPFCAKFAREVHPVVDREYVDSGKVLWSFYHLPLESLHPRALRAATAAHCAATEGKFWPYYERLFTDPALRSDDDHVRWARELGLAHDVTQCASEDVTNEIARQVPVASQFGIRGTPGFVVGRLDESGRVVVSQRLSGFRSAIEFKKVLDDLLR